MPSAHDLLILAVIYFFAYWLGVFVSKFWVWLRFTIIFVFIFTFYQNFNFSDINLPIFLVIILPILIFVFPSVKIIINNPNNPINKIIFSFASFFENINGLFYKYKRYKIAQAQRQAEREEEKRRRDEDEKQRKAEERELQYVKQALQYIFKNCKSTKRFKELLQNAQIKFTRNPVIFTYLPSMKEYDLITLDLQNEFNIFIINLGNKKANEEQSQQNPPKSPYDIIGVSEHMSLAEIKAIYAELVKIYHPDTGKVKDAKKFIEVTEAFKEIRNLKNG
jgi:curved DNA-binding protein CbpA